MKSVCAPHRDCVKYVLCTARLASLIGCDRPSHLQKPAHVARPEGEAGEPASRVYRYVECHGVRSSPALRWEAGGGLGRLGVAGDGWGR